jgi:hypothetical protein
VIYFTALHLSLRQIDFRRDGVAANGTPTYRSTARASN